MFKRYFSLLIIISGALLGSANAQNVPELNVTAPAGNVTEITVPPEIGAGLSSWNSVTHYSPKVKITDPNAIETATGDQVNQSIDYRDGNNQTFQTIIFNHSRGASQQLNGLVQPYDTRQQQDKYSFLPVPNDNATQESNAFAASKSYYLSLYPNEGYTSYSAQKYASTADYRETRTYAPGKSQAGENRYTAQRPVTNDAGQVRIWELDASGYPESSAFYPAGTLFGVQTTDPEGQVTLTFKNKSGQLVLKEVQDGASSYASTYYVYDDLGNLIYTLPPKAVDASGSGTVSAAVRNQLCFHYVYDSKGRLAAQSKPGEDGALTEVVYDRKQRPVMRQTPAEQSAGKWEVTFYDPNGRVIATSLFNDNSTRDTWQNVFDSYSGATYPTNSLEYYLLTDAGEGVYPPENGISGNTVMSYTWYDNYSVVDPDNSIYNTVNAAINFAGTVLPPGAELPQRSLRTQGLVTGTMIRILPAPGVDTATTGDWTQTANFYDDQGRLIYSEIKDSYHNQTLHQQYVGTEYDFSGKVILVKHILDNQRGKDGLITHTEMTRNVYDDYSDQLTDVYHSMDGSPWNTLATYQYDDLGNLSREMLGDHGEVRDYTYNIRGQVTGINGPYAETGDSGSESRSFGESLKYDYGFSQPRYDGKIAGMVWRGSGGAQAKALAYGYTYDDMGRLTAADFREGPDQNGQYITPSAWDKDTMDYSVSKIAYDKNSNILSKNMMGPGYYSANNVNHPTAIDQLTYTYPANSNRLASVSDAITTNFGDGDFQDGNTSGNDYAYDADGNLQQDLNKGIRNVTYTYFDKPQTVTFQNGSTIRYSYNAAGGKVQEQIATNSLNKRTGYVGNFVYQNDTLQYASTAVGRTVWNEDTTKEEFFVKDHLGNVRSIVEVYKYPLQQYLATYEIASAQLEELFFDDVADIRDDKPGSTDPEDTKAGLLNGADSATRIGTSILLKVMAGDRVQLNADNYYDGSYNSRNDQPVQAEDMLNSIVSTLTAGVGGLGSSESHDPQLVPRLFNPTNFAEADNIMHRNADPNRPKAFLNYVLFDENMQVVATFTGAFQADGNGSWQNIGNTEPMTIPVNGFLAVYVSNASHVTTNPSDGDVYFDNIQIRISKGKLMLETHYYPFGLPMAGTGGDAPGMTLNRQKYQSNEYITEAGLNWMSFGARQYDPQTGRFLSVDPMADAGGQDMLSPYQAMGNDPVSMTDVTGMQPQMQPYYSEDQEAQQFIMGPPAGFAPSTLKIILSQGDPLAPGGDFSDDPMWSSRWIFDDYSKGGQAQSNKSFWNSVMKTYNGLSEGTFALYSNNGDGSFNRDLVYNLYADGGIIPAWEREDATKNETKIGPADHSGTSSSFSFTYSGITSVTDAYGTATAGFSTTVAFVNSTEYGSLNAMNYVSGISQGMSKAGDLFTIGFDLYGIKQYYSTGNSSPFSVSPSQATVDGVFMYIGEVGDLPGIVISSVYFIVARPVIWGGGAQGLMPYMSIPNADNTRVYIPQYQ